SFSGDLRARTEYERWLVRDIALATARIDRVTELQLANFKRLIERAENCWESDRTAAAEELGKRLPKVPWLVSRLKLTRQGTEWLTQRGERLGAVVGTRGDLEEDQRQLALDLLAVPQVLRNGCADLPPAGETAALAELIAGKVAELRQWQENTLDAMDERAQ